MRGDWVKKCGLALCRGSNSQGIGEYNVSRFPEAKSGAFWNTKWLSIIKLNSRQRSYRRSPGGYSRRGDFADGQADLNVSQPRFL